MLLETRYPGLRTQAGADDEQLLKPFTGTGGSREPPVPNCPLLGESKQAADDRKRVLVSRIIFWLGKSKQVADDRKPLLTGSWV